MSISTIPPYFCWVVDRLLAISSTPYHHTHLNYLIKNKIHTVVSFLDNPQPPYHSNPLLKVISYSARALLQQSDCDQFVRLIEESDRRGEAVLVHGAKGVDIAGVFVACYLVKKWHCPADFVISYLRGIMPSCIEGVEQEDIVYEFHTRLFGKTYSEFYPSKVGFLGNPLQIEEKLIPTNNRTINSYEYE